MASNNFEAIRYQHTVSNMYSNYFDKTWQFLQLKFSIVLFFLCFSDYKLWWRETSFWRIFLAKKGQKYKSTSEDWQQQHGQFCSPFVHHGHQEKIVHRTRHHWLFRTTWKSYWLRRFGWFYWCFSAMDAIVKFQGMYVWKNWNNFVNSMYIVLSWATKNSYAFFTILVPGLGAFFKSLKITLKAIPLQIFVNTHCFFQMCFKCLCHTKCFQIYVTCHEDCHYFITYDTWRFFAHQLFTNT